VQHRIDRIKVEAVRTIVALVVISLSRQYVVSGRESVRSGRVFQTFTGELPVLLNDDAVFPAEYFDLVIGPQLICLAIAAVFCRTEPVDGVLGSISRCRAADSLQPSCGQQEMAERPEPSGQSRPIR
jgi:hypothetical protein